MRAVVQRVKEANVTVEEKVIGRIGRGLLVFLGVEDGDTQDDLRYVCDKVAGLRIFEDAADKLNLSVVDIGGSILLVSQFTLLGDVRNGRRPSFTRAARPEEARRLYEEGAKLLRTYVPVETGEFQALMQVGLINDGPVTILVDSKRAF